MTLVGVATARDIMNPDVMTVPEDLPLKDLATFLVENEISGVPVVNDNGEISGVVSLRDIASATAEEGSVRLDRSSSFYLEGWEDQLDPFEAARLRFDEKEQEVRDVMTPTVFSVQSDTPISSVARAMVAGRIHRLLVVDGPRLNGIITTLDILRHLFPLKG